MNVLSILHKYSTKMSSVSINMSSVSANVFVSIKTSFEFVVLNEKKPALIGTQLLRTDF